MRDVPESGASVVDFAEKIVALLDTGSFTTSYKYAVLLALIDETLEGVGQDGSAPSLVRGTDVARRAFELYWEQSRGYAGGDHPLRQSSQRDLVVKAAELRRRLGAHSETSLREAKRRHPEIVEAVEQDVVVTILRYPIPLLQRLGDGPRTVEDRFIYEYSWSGSVSARATRQPDFDDRLIFVGEAAEHLVSLAGLIRPLVERQWVEHVARRNPAEVDELRLAEYLFGTERVALQQLAGPLRELQGGGCFYCGRSRGPWEVDHFIARSRWADDSLDNLVVADQRCNNAKRTALAGTDALNHWWRRFDRAGQVSRGLDRIATDAGWYRRQDAAVGVARALYLRQPAGTALWTPDGVEPLNPDVIQELLGSADSLQAADPRSEYKP